MRDILAILSVGLSPVVFFWLPATLFPGLTTLFSTLMLVALILIVLYATGTLGAAFSGRKGFDALFPVSIGAVLSIFSSIAFLVLIYR